MRLVDAREAERGTCGRAALDAARLRFPAGEGGARGGGARLAASAARHRRQVTQRLLEPTVGETLGGDKEQPRVRRAARISSLEIIQREPPLPRLLIR